MATQVLAGDIGGTKTALAVYRFEEARTARLEAEETFPSREYRGLEEIVHEFLGTRGEPLAAAAFGIAGAVLAGEVSATNLPWKLSERQLAEEVDARYAGAGDPQPEGVAAGSGGGPPGPRS
jgi:glucokinase